MDPKLAGVAEFCAYCFIEIVEKLAECGTEKCMTQCSRQPGVFGVRVLGLRFEVRVCKKGGPKNHYPYSGGDIQIKKKLDPPSSTGQEL